MSQSSLSTSAPTRRRVVKGAAWALPAVAFAAHAPAIAVSGDCLSIPSIDRWTQSDQDVNEKPFRLVNGGRTLEAIIDWAWWFGKGRPELGFGWARTPLNVDPGHRYTINLALETCWGYNWPGQGSPDTCETNNTTLEVRWLPSGGAPKTIFSGTTQPKTGFKEFRPLDNCTGPVTNRTPLWKKFPNELVTFEVPCGAARTGSLELRFTAYPHARILTAGSPQQVSKTQFSNQNNDDWRVTPTIESCERIENC